MVEMVESLWCNMHTCRKGYGVCGILHTVCMMQEATSNQLFRKNNNQISAYCCLYFGIFRDRYVGNSVGPYYLICAGAQDMYGLILSI
jgi:hypothetical protein